MSADPGNPFAAFLLGGLFVAVPTALALPAGMLLHSRRGRWFDRTAAAAEGRRTACLLVGAGVVVAAFLGVAVLGNVKALGWAAVLLALAVIADFLVGFAACSWNQGRRMLGRDAGISCLVHGWLARAGAAAVPFLWPLVVPYLVSVACGAPVVALMTRDAASNATTAPSDGQTATL